MQWTGNFPTVCQWTEAGIRSHCCLIPFIQNVQNGQVHRGRKLICGGLGLRQAGVNREQPLWRQTTSEAVAMFSNQPELTVAWIGDCTKSHAAVNLETVVFICDICIHKKQQVMLFMVIRSILMVPGFSLSISVKPHLLPSSVISLLCIVIMYLVTTPFFALMFLWIFLETAEFPINL